MANIITAGNSTNGGTAISTDTSGTLNIVTGSGSGSNAITIDASQNVTIAGTATAPNLFGQSQTWQDVKASRAFGTTYTNTTNRPIFLYIYSATTVSNTFTVTVSGVSWGGYFYSTSNGGNPLAIIPAGSTYSVSTTATTTVQNWMELR